jgi:hypothetical protein
MSRISQLTLGLACMAALFLVAAFTRSPPAIPIVRTAGTEADLALILAVDTSHSMDQRQLHIQRDGYVKAFLGDKLMAAVETGEHGRIAVLYMEWAGPTHQVVVIPWTVIDAPEDAVSFATRLAAEPLVQPVTSNPGTSISGALKFAARLFPDEASTATRHVIDISGNGANNIGGPVKPARDVVVASGITINGLPLALPGVETGSTAPIALARYYENCVIGGPDAFSIVVDDMSRFEDAIRRKLLREIVAQNGRQFELARSTAKARADYDCAAPGERPVP